MKTFLLLILIFPLAYFLFPHFAAAAILNIWAGTGQGGDQTCNISGNQPCTFCDALKVVSNIIRYLFELAIPIAVGMIVYGALRLMVAGGSEEQVKNARSIITNAVIGLIIALAAWAIVGTVLHRLAGDFGNKDFHWNSFQCQTPARPTPPSPPATTECPPPTCISCQFPPGCPQSSPTTPTPPNGWICKNRPGDPPHCYTTEGDCKVGCLAPDKICEQPTPACTPSP